MNQHDKANSRRSLCVYLQLDKGQNFTQSDVSEGRVRYEHNVGFDGDSSMSDEFDFTLSDGLNSSPRHTFKVSFSSSTDPFIVSFYTMTLWNCQMIRRCGSIVAKKPEN